MTLHLDGETVRRLCTPAVARRACRDVLAAQRGRDVRLPPRLDVDVPTGFLRVMPAAIRDHMGLKVMTLARGVGNRYLLLVYASATGELVAVLDADEITRLRTAATTAVAGELLHPAGTDRIGLVGTGFEAEGHLRAFADLWPLSRVDVYSRSAARRAAFAERMSAELGIAVNPADSVDEVIANAPVSVLCTKSVQPVVDGSMFPEGAVVLSIGSTRPDLRELDRETLLRSVTLLVDDAGQVTAESGDIADGLESGALAAEQIVDMADWSGPAPLNGDGRDLLTFKSVGTALHDLALASVVLEVARRDGLGRELGELCSLKAVSPPAVDTTEGVTSSV